MQLTVDVKVCEVSIVGCFRCQQLLSVEYMVTSSGHLTAVALCFVQACPSLSTIKQHFWQLLQDRIESAAIPELVLNLNQFL